MAAAATQPKFEVITHMTEERLFSQARYWLNNAGFHLAQRDLDAADASMGVANEHLAELVNRRGA